jgi:hypothetical protein
VIEEVFRICIWKKNQVKQSGYKNSSWRGIKTDVFVSREVPSLGEGRKNRGNPDYRRSQDDKISGDHLTAVN